MTTRQTDKKWYEAKEIWMIGFLLFSVYFTDFWKEQKESLTPKQVEQNVLLLEIQFTIKSFAEQLKKIK
ncbi:hypothetical protein P5P81_00760 [Tritonibacter mobilis]|nr:hypothetical protein [Tritonibacter mobilis]